jgi:hypothetical protein
MPIPFAPIALKKDFVTRIQAIEALKATQRADSAPRRLEGDAGAGLGSDRSARVPNGVILTGKTDQAAPRCDFAPVDDPSIF